MSFQKDEKNIKFPFHGLVYLDYASVTNPRTEPCGSQLQWGYMRSCFSKCEMKLENPLKAGPAIKRVSLITHFYGPYSSSHLFITVLCLAGILMRPETEKQLSSKGKVTSHDHGEYPWQAYCVASVVSNSLQPHGLYSSPGSSVHGTLQARILEWGAMPSSRGQSQPRDQI